ncbi:MAG: PAS domain S-box protein [Symploca sp. SIO2B6]|nr:PAS domain S-box protein [Symploca sp. SIO2B6]
MSIPLHVLVLEDSLDDTELMLEELIQAEFDPIWQRVETESEYLAQLSPDLDIILSDYTMPQFNASRALELLQEQGLDIPFIVVTGTITEATALELTQSGASDYLIKDRMARLGRAVAQAIEEKQLRQEKQKAELAQRTSETRFQAIFNQTFQFIWLLTPQGKIQEANQTALDFSGLQLDEVVGYNFWETRWWGFVSTIQAQLQKVIFQAAEGDLVRCEIDIWGAESQVVTIDFSLKPFTDQEGKIVLLVAEGRDITKRQQVEKQLQLLNAELAQRVEERTADLAQSNQQLRLEIAERQQIEATLRQERDLMNWLLENSPAGMVMVNHQGNITFANKRSEEILGLTRAEIISRTYNEPTWHSTTLEGFPLRVEQYPFRRVMKAAEPIYDMRHAIQWSNGEQVLLSISGAPIFDADDQVDGVLFTLDNITERQQLEAGLRKALEEEKELNQLKSNFISIVSHEFRTPMTSIKMSADLLKRYGHRASEEKRNQHLLRIEKSIDYMTKLIEDVIIINRTEAGVLQFSPESLDLVQFCQELIADLQTSELKQHKLVFSSQHDCCLVQMDENLLRLIFVNLLSNAIKYSPLGGKVTFSLNCTPDAVIFQVQDLGIGIPPEDQQRLFESFQRASNVGNIPGTGIGLAIVKKAVDLHSGQITLKSEVGLGTTFTVTIPISC